MVILVPPFWGHIRQGSHYMNVKKKSVFLACTVLSASLITASSFISAAPAEVDLNYTCIFPLLKDQPMSVHITADIPESVAPNIATDNFSIDAIATVNDEAWNGLYFVGGRTLTGNVIAKASLVIPPGLLLDLQVLMSLDAAELPNERSSFDVNAHGETPSLTFPQEGNAVISVGDLLMNITPEDHLGNTTGLGEFESVCTLNPGQSPILRTIKVAKPTSGIEATLAGNTTIGNASSTINLGGNLQADVSNNTATNADITFEKTTGTFKSSRFFGLLTGTSEIILTSAPDSTASLSNDSLKVQTDLDMALPNLSIKLFGFKVPAGDMSACHTKSPASITLTTPAGETFSSVEGGRISGNYTISSFENCGGINSFVNYLLSGSDNSMNLTLTPKN